MLGDPLRQEADSSSPTFRSALVTHNVVVGGHRTSMRFEPSMWEALLDLCRRERLTIHELSTFVAASKSPGLNLTAALRVLITNYFRNASTEQGHLRAAHGHAALKHFRHLVDALHGNRARPTAL